MSSKQSSLEMGESSPLKAENRLSVPAGVHKKSKYDEIKDDTKKEWVTLPSSVNGTLIYFLLVENNCEGFSLSQFLTSLFYVGFPVFFTFYLQALLLFTLHASVPAFATDGVICSTGPLVQHAVISIFIIFLIPSLKSVITEYKVIMNCEAVAFDHETDEDWKRIVPLENGAIKKILTFFVVPAPESIILLSLFYVGTGFM
jgi:hypothetical protein